MRAVLIDAVNALVEKHGGVRAAARVIGTDPSYLSRIRTGKKWMPSDGLLRKLGLRRVITITYEKTR